MLNAMQQLMTGGSEYFDPAFLNKLKDCWDDTDADLRDASNGAWQGIIDYWDNDGYADDTWGSRNGSWYEYNPRTQDFHNMIIYEPCNYASNMAYYHDATEMCYNKNRLSMSRDSYVAIIQSFSFLAYGSSVMHGTNTRLGALDVHMIKVLSYAIYQASVEHLIDLGASAIITDLKSTSRALNGVQIARSMSDMFLAMPVTQWLDHINAMDLPDMELSFAAIVSSILSTSLDNQQLSTIFQKGALPFKDFGSLISFLEHGAVDFLVPVLMDLFDLGQEQRDFIINQYIPEVILSYKNLSQKECDVLFIFFSSETSQKTCSFPQFKSCALRRISYQQSRSSSMHLCGRNRPSKYHLSLIQLPIFLVLDHCE